MEMYRYYFHIIEEDGSEYDYQDYFEDHDIASKFIEENEDEGNTVICVSPYYEKVLVDPKTLNNITVKVL